MSRGEELVVRVGRYKHSRKPACHDRGSFGESEFEPLDLSPSVYVVDRIQVVQAYSEHSASHLGPVGSLFCWDLTGLSDSVKVLGDTSFAFTREHHHELTFGTVDEREVMIDRLWNEMDERVIEIQKTAVAGFIRGRLDDEDVEWMQLCNDKPKWRKLAGR